jgi:hypothetical protein
LSPYACLAYSTLLRVVCVVAFAPLERGVILAHVVLRGQLSEHLLVGWLYHDDDDDDDDDDAVGRCRHGKAGDRRRDRAAG